MDENRAGQLSLIYAVFGGLLAIILAGLLIVTIRQAVVARAQRDGAPGGQNVAMESVGSANAEQAAESNHADEVSIGEEPAPDASSEASATAAEAGEGQSTDDGTADGAEGTENAAGEETADTATQNGADAADADAAVDPAPSGPTSDVIAAIGKGGCGACHVIPGVPGAIGVVGPDLTTIGTDAATRVEGQSAEVYIHESLVNPNAFTAEECPTGPCPAGVMTPNLEDILSVEEIDAIVNYLLTLKSE